MDEADNVKSVALLYPKFESILINGTLCMII
ncbi:MAG: hypothetical protein ACI9P5_003716, partial [Saprospiraceae bacterium]